MREKLSQVVVAGAVVLALPSLVAPGSTLASVTYLAGLVMLAAALVAGARSLTAAERPVWLPWCLGVGCAVAGSVAGQVTAFAASPVLADVMSVCWMVFYVPITVTTVRMMRHRVPAVRDRRTVVQDVAVVTAAATVFAWQLLIQPVLSAGPAPGAWALIQSVFFPLGDVVLVALGLTLLLVPGHRSAAERLILTGFGAAFLADLAMALLPPTAVLDAGFTAGYLVINAVVTAAVLHPSRTMPVTPARSAVETSGIRGWRMFMLGGALCSIGVSSTLTEGQGWDQAPVAAAMVVMVALILVRLNRAAADAEAAHQLMRHAATHDRLTGVANRAKLFDDLRHAVVHSPTLFFVDLDAFKAVNDTHGHHCGDTVLTTVARRLTGLVRRTDTVARLGGDEFVIVCTDLAPEDTAALAARIEEAIGRPIATEAGPLRVGASIGVTRMADVTTDGSLADELVNQLLRTADAAMYEAKRDGGGTRSVEYVPAA